MSSLISYGTICVVIFEQRENFAREKISAAGTKY